MEEAIIELGERTLSHMNTMLNNQSTEAAIQIKNTRDRMQFVDVPPTNPGIVNIYI
jgi:hypothetical protein